MRTTAELRSIPTAHQLERLFSAALKRVAVLHESLLPPHGDRNRGEHAREARIRVQQLRVILRRIHALHAQDAKLKAKVSVLDRATLESKHKRLQRQKGRIKLELGIQAEAFYYLAHRATKCIQYAMETRSSHRWESVTFAIT